MHLHIVTALAILVAAPVSAATDRAAFTSVTTPPVDWLYPEIDVDEEGFRGLIPVILLDMESVANAPVTDEDDKQAN